jgi:hypothetical protein
MSSGRFPLDTLSYLEVYYPYRAKRGKLTSRSMDEGLQERVAVECSYVHLR